MHGRIGTLSIPFGFTVVFGILDMVGLTIVCAAIFFAGGCFALQNRSSETQNGSASIAKGNFPGWAAPIIGPMLGGILLGALSQVDKELQQVTIVLVIVGALEGLLAGLFVWSRENRRQEKRINSGAAECS